MENQQNDKQEAQIIDANQQKTADGQKQAENAAAQPADKAKTGGCGCGCSH